MSAAAAYSNRVLYGPFVGKTKSDLETLLTAAQAELGDGGGGTITGASVNGQSFQKTAGPSVLSRIRMIQSALAQVDPDYIAPTHAIATRFRAPCY
jgi:hypothetical protein